MENEVPHQAAREDASHDFDIDRMVHFPTAEELVDLWTANRCPNVLKFEELGLVVKIGHHEYHRVRIDEANALRFIRKSYPLGEVPVPEIYAFQSHKQYNLLYMSHVPGQTLMQAWPDMVKAEKEVIASQLSSIVVALRSLTHATRPHLIGSADDGPVRDMFLRWTHQAGGYDSLSCFHDMLSEYTIPAVTRNEGFVDPYRELLPDDSRVFFSHADLTPTNIIVAGPPGERRISSVIDWEQAGWYPEYWEYCKLNIGCPYDHEWRTEGWADKVMQVYHDEVFALAEYWQIRPP